MINNDPSLFLPLDKINIDVDSEFIIYSDLDINLEEHPYTQDFKVPTNAASIRQSIINLLQTKHYEKLWHPEIGSFFSQILFSQADNISIQQAKNEVFRLFNEWEPRITINSVDITPIDGNPSALNVVIKYTINLINYSDEISWVITRTR